MSTWVAEAEVTYRVVRGGQDWVLRRTVAGAVPAILNLSKTLREAKTAAEADRNSGLL
jgi:hypothetical protein